MKIFWTLMEILINAIVIVFIITIIPHEITGSWYFWDCNLFWATLYCITFIVFCASRTCDIIDRRYSTKEEYEAHKRELVKDLSTEGYD